MIACKEGNFDLAELLLENGANIDATTKVSFIICIFNGPLASEVPRRNILSLLV